MELQISVKCTYVSSSRAKFEVLSLVAISKSNSVKCCYDFILVPVIC